jgi:hypothetical protein
MASDWYLPSKDELDLMYGNLHAHSVGGFANAMYWSSSEVNASAAWWQDFTPSGMGQNFNAKSDGCRVRAMRNFTADASLYALRDVGPASGWICYKSGASGAITYLEAAPVDQSTSIEWITGGDTQTEAIGTTGTAIGTGLANTNAMAADDGYTGGAAKVCLDLAGGYDWAYSIVIDLPITKVGVDEISTNLTTERTAKGLGAVTAPSITQYSTSLQKTHMDTWRSMCVAVVRYAGADVPTWSESITQYATSVKALHFTELRQVADDAKNLARCYTNTCAAACGLACTASCTTNCGAACSTTCSATCANTCQVTYCTITCSTACSATCTGCHDKCTGGCTGSTCTASCVAGTCANNCYIYCNIYCLAACKVACSNAQSACANCTGMCYNDNCKQVCGPTATCTAGCKNGCNPTCTSCTGTCEAACSADCHSVCTGGCGNTCTAACTSNGGSCGGTCSATTCSASCGVTCTASCLTNCTGGCQYNCYNSCNLGCTLACTVTARVGTDAGVL